jgi:hypothetical protein
VYVWVRRALGRYAGALASLLYWACTPMWVGGSVAVLSMAVWRQFVGPLPAAGQFGLGAAFIAVATITAVIPLKSGKWIPVSGTAGQALLLVFFTVTVAVYGAQHGVHGIAAGDLAPTGTVFIAVAPVLLFSFSGAELPAAAAEEMTDPRRDIPAAIGQAGAALVVMYAVPVLAVLIVLPAGAVTSLHGFLDALTTVLTVYGGSAGDPGGTPVLAGGGQVAGWACAALFIWVLMSSAAAWIMGAGRAQAAACLDGAGPRFLGRVSARTGVPARIGLLSGAIALLIMAAGVAVTGQDNQKYFSAALTAVIALSRAGLPAGLPRGRGAAAAPARPAPALPGARRPGRGRGGHDRGYRLVRAGRGLPAVAGAGHGPPGRAPACRLRRPARPVRAAGTDPGRGHRGRGDRVLPGHPLPQPITESQRGVTNADRHFLPGVRRPGRDHRPVLAAQHGRPRRARGHVLRGWAPLPDAHRQAHRPSPDICPSSHTCNIAHTGVNHAGTCFIRSSPHGGIMGYLHRIGLPPRTVQICIRCQENPAGFWVSGQIAGVTRRPWCLSCCQQLDRNRCAIAPFAR